MQNLVVLHSSRAHLSCAFSGAPSDLRQGFVTYNSAVVEDFLKLGSSLLALMRGQIPLPAHVDGIKRGGPKTRRAWSSP
jgi:hypothetical protein